MEVAGTNIPSLWDKHPGVLGDAKLFMVRTLLNKRHTLHFRCDSRKKTVPPYFHIHVPMYIYICLYEQNWRLWQCHGGYVHQLGFHVCFISATGSHLRWCLRLEKPIPLYIYKAYMFGLYKGISPTNYVLFWAKKWYWNSPLICPSCCVRWKRRVRWVTSLMIWWKVLPRSGGLALSTDEFLPKVAQWIGWSWVTKLVYNSYNI